MPFGQPPQIIRIGRVEILKRFFEFGQCGRCIVQQSAGWHRQQLGPHRFGHRAKAFHDGRQREEIIDGGVEPFARAEPGSAAEKSALQQTMPTLSSCLAGGKDSKLAIDRTMLRGYLAESLYAQRLPAG